MPEIVPSPPPVAALDGLYKWLGDGTIPAYKVAGSWVILAEEVKAMIAAGRNQPRPRID